MIRFESRFDAYAYRMSFPVKDGVTVEEGQWVELDENSELVLATADSAKAFMAMGSNRESCKTNSSITWMLCCNYRPSYWFFSSNGCP